MEGKSLRRGENIEKKGITHHRHRRKAGGAAYGVAHSLVRMAEFKLGLPLLAEYFLTATARGPGVTGAVGNDVYGAASSIR